MGYPTHKSQCPQKAGFRKQGTRHVENPRKTTLRIAGAAQFSVIFVGLMPNRARPQTIESAIP
jgi:hypothetical protein